ncbi:MAG: CDP-alcohol phosphatidyltransferase family protein [Holosporales bacterium]|nr:CDP-alcohol phosphatidyltransferase family protein [Holosporales bacterium]
MSPFVRYVPNGLSFVRILCAPIFLYFGTTVASVYILILAGLTDFLDGYTARKFKVESKFGQILDPIADKIFCNTALWYIYTTTGHRSCILWAAVVLTLRDVSLIIGGILINFYGLKMDTRPIYISKICTTLIITLCGLLLIPNVPLPWIQACAISCVVCVVYTGYRYARRIFF